MKSFKFIISLSSCYFLVACQTAKLNPLTEMEFEDIKDKYYSLKETGAAGYNCSVRSNFARVVALPYLKQGIFTEKEYENLDNITFEFQVHENGFCQAQRVEELEIENPNLNAFFSNAFSQSEKFLIDFCRILRLMHIQNPLVEVLGENGQLSRSSDGYDILTKERRRRVGYVSSDYREIQSETRSENATIYFQPHNKKLVPEILVLEKSGQRIIADLSFKPAVDHLMPDVIRITAEIKDQGERSLTYTFDSCTPVLELSK